MSDDLLPESVNSFLDGFETCLCLPILIIMVLCTAQFVFNHIIDIGLMIYRNIRKMTKKEKRNKKPVEMMGKFQGCSNNKRMNSPPKRNQLSSVRRVEKEEWDYDEQNLE